MATRTDEGTSRLSFSVLSERGIIESKRGGLLSTRTVNVCYQEGAKSERHLRCKHV